MRRCFVTFVTAFTIGMLSTACGTDEESPADTLDAIDAAGDTAGDTGETPDAVGQSCVNNGDACPSGLSCVQSQPPYCSVDYLGTCEAVPTSCPTPAAGDAVVACDGTTYASACEARKAGDTTWLEPAP